MKSKQFNGLLHPKENKLIEPNDWFNSAIESIEVTGVEKILITVNTTNDIKRNIIFENPVNVTFDSTHNVEDLGFLRNITSSKYKIEFDNMDVMKII